MTLFQPTSITPSTLGGEIGNGVVDLTQDLVVSWQVNGNSPMTGYKINIYQNNAASTSVYNTGTITLAEPFYGVDYKGEAQFFSHTISVADISSAGMSNGNEYKLRITQYWSNNGSTKTVNQASASVFIGRDEPTLEIDTIDNPVTANAYSFSATYAQAQGDNLAWVRWQLAYSDDTGNPFYDTHNIYGTAQLRMDYDGLFPDTIYAVRCIVQTESGIVVATGWQRFLVDYATTNTTGFVNAKCLRSKSAIAVGFDGLKHIPATTSGTYSLSNGMLIMASGSQVYWNNTNDVPMSVPMPWTVIHKWVARGDVTEAMSLRHGNGLSFTEYIAGGVLTVGGETLLTVNNGAEITTMVTPTTTYVRVTRYAGGLYPSTSLTPSTTLTPVADTATTTTYIIDQIVNAPIEGVVLKGPQDCDYIQVFNGDVAASLYDDVIANGTYTPVYDENTYMLADFNRGLDAGNVGESSSNLAGYDVYRRETGESTLQYVGTAGAFDKGLYDHTAANQQEYTYYVFPLGDDGMYLTSPLVSNPIRPCWWDWTILECEKNSDDEDSYSLIALYRFGNNVATDAISNNNTPYIAANFTRYPTVQLTPQNYQSGTLGSLIGHIDYENGNEYTDTIALRNAIWGLSTTTNTLFLKNRKGDLLQIQVGGPITMTTSDATKGQIQTMALPWVEVGSADDVAIFGGY